MIAARMPSGLKKLGLAVASSVLAFLVLGEAGVRLWNPPSVRIFDSRLMGAPGERVMKVDSTDEVHPRHGIFQLDDALGYRPVPGGEGYGPHGAKWNEYAPEKPAGKRRLLFLGDSVTDRHKIIDALHERLGDGYEYWNAGVVGYTTQQELAYYRDYLGGILADHVILTFHLNDYDVTPVVFEVGDEIVAVHSRVGHSTPNPWLLRHSYVYRFGWSWAVRRSAAERARSIEADVEDGLAALRDLARARGADFTVLVLPWILPRERWTEPRPRHHRLTLEVLERLGIRHYAFLDTLDRAVRDGVEIHESARDPQHPGDELARRIVGDLLAAGFTP